MPDPDRPSRPAPTTRDRFYVTTAIAYANSKPGVHTLYEVIAADALARWHRMRGIPTRFLTGTDEHSVNIAMRAAEEGRTPKAFVDEKVALFQAAEAALLIAPDRFIRTTDPDHVHSAQEMVRRAYANGDIYVGTYEGWYCPNEGFRNATDVVETAAGTICPNHPDVPLQWLSERNWFFRLSSYQERLERWFEEHPDFVQPDYRRNEMLGFIRGGLEDFSISRAGAGWGIPFPVLPDGSDARRPDGTWDPDAGTIYVWYDALINYITGAGFPDDPALFGRWWPADLHVIGKDIARFHTLFWPAMLWSAGLEAPRHVWVHGWLLAQGERMSKSRGNFLDPLDFVAAFGADGARYVALREVAFDRDSDVSWDGFLRRYNADLANDFGNLVNRTITMAGRYLGAERPAPRPTAAAPLAGAWAETRRLVEEKLDACLLHEALAALWDFVGRVNKTVDAEAPWTLAKAAKAGDEEAAARLRHVLGDLLEACRLVALAAAPVMPGAAPRVLAQLGHAYPWDERGDGGPPLLAELTWGARAGDAGTLGTPSPLFPRLEIEAPDDGAGSGPGPAAPGSDSAGAGSGSAAPGSTAPGSTGSGPAGPNPGSAAPASS